MGDALRLDLGLAEDLVGLPEIALGLGVHEPRLDPDERRDRHQRIGRDGERRPVAALNELPRAASERPGTPRNRLGRTASSHEEVCDPGAIPVQEGASFEAPRNRL